LNILVDPFQVRSNHNISGGWDGTFKGKPLDSAVFVYYLELTFTNGDHATNKGNVTLIRWHVTGKAWTLATSSLLSGGLFAKDVD